MTDEFDPFDQEAEESSFELHAEGEWHSATLVAIDYEKDGQYGPQLKWRFVVDGDEGKGKDGADRETWHFTGAKYTINPKAGLYNMMKWLTGETFAQGERVPIKEQVGKTFKLMFDHVDKSDGSGKREKLIRAKPVAPF